MEEKSEKKGKSAKITERASGKEGKSRPPKATRPAKEPKPPKVRRERRHPVLTKVLVRIVTILMLAAIFGGASYIYLKKFATVKEESKSTMIEKQLSLCKEIVTAKYHYSDIMSIKKSLGFSKSYSIIKYSGILRVGIEDFSAITYKISFDQKTVTIAMPDCQVLGNELVSQEVFDEKHSIFVPISTQEIFDEIEESRNQTAEDLLAEGVVDEANAQAKSVITQFMYSIGFENVEFAENKSEIQ